MKRDWGLGEAIAFLSKQHTSIHLAIQRLNATDTERVEVGVEHKLIQPNLVFSLLTFLTD